MIEAAALAVATAREGLQEYKDAEKLAKERRDTFKKEVRGFARLEVLIWPHFQAPQPPLWHPPGAWVRPPGSPHLASFGLISRHLNPPVGTPQVRGPVWTPPGTSFPGTPTPSVPFFCVRRCALARLEMPPPPMYRLTFRHTNPTPP